MQPRRNQLLFTVLALTIVCLIFTLMAHYGLMTSSQKQRQRASALSERESLLARDSPDKGVPCIVHQSWKTQNLPSTRVSRWRKTWLKCLPQCRHLLWTDQDNRKLVRQHYPWLLNLYDELKSGVQRADLTRYLYLLHYGGIYADIDTVCLQNFQPLLSGLGLAFGGMDGHWISSVNGSYVQNSFMASRRAHPFWIGLLHRILRQHRLRTKAGAEESTGPLILMKELQQYLDDKQTDVKIFPPSYFNPFSWITNDGRSGCKTRGAMTDAEEVTCIDSFPGAYVVQMHSKTWAGGKA